MPAILSIDSYRSHSSLRFKVFRDGTPSLPTYLCKCKQTLETLSMACNLVSKYWNWNIQGTVKIFALEPFSHLSSCYGVDQCSQTGLHQTVFHPQPGPRQSLNLLCTRIVFNPLNCLLKIHLECFIKWKLTVQFFSKLLST